MGFIQMSGWFTIKEMKRKYLTAEISIKFQGRTIRMKWDYELLQP